MPAEYIAGKSNFVHIRQRSRSREITSGLFYILILTGKDELFNTLHFHVFMPIPSKKLKFWVHLLRDRWSHLAYLKGTEASHGLSL